MKPYLIILTVLATINCCHCTRSHERNVHKRRIIHEDDKDEVFHRMEGEGQQYIEDSARANEQADTRSRDYEAVNGGSKNSFNTGTYSISGFNHPSSTNRIYRQFENYSGSRTQSSAQSNSKGNIASDSRNNIGADRYSAPLYHGLATHTTSKNNNRVPTEVRNPFDLEAELNDKLNIGRNTADSSHNIGNSINTENKITGFRGLSTNVASLYSGKDLAQPKGHISLTGHAIGEVNGAENIGGGPRNNIAGGTYSGGSGAIHHQTLSTNIASLYSRRDISQPKNHIGLTGHSIVKINRPEDNGAGARNNIGGSAPSLYSNRPHQQSPTYLGLSGKPISINRINEGGSIGSSSRNKIGNGLYSAVGEGIHRTLSTNPASINNGGDNGLLRNHISLSRQPVSQLSEGNDPKRYHISSTYAKSDFEIVKGSFNNELTNKVSEKANVVGGSTAPVTFPTPEPDIPLQVPQPTTFQISRNLYIPVAPYILPRSISNEGISSVAISVPVPIVHIPPSIRVQQSSVTSKPQTSTNFVELHPVNVVPSASVNAPQSSSMASRPVFVNVQKFYPVTAKPPVPINVHQSYTANSKSSVPIKVPQYFTVASKPPASINLPQYYTATPKSPVLINIAQSYTATPKSPVPISIARYYTATPKSPVAITVPQHYTVPKSEISSAVPQISTDSHQVDAISNDSNQRIYPGFKSNIGRFGSISSKQEQYVLHRGPVGNAKQELSAGGSFVSDYSDGKQ